MAEHLFSKEEVAAHLLDQAVAAWLDRSDPLTAIVIGGAAEDLYQGLLTRAGREAEAARAQMLVHIRAFVRLQDPQVVMKDSDGHAVLRSAYNWLRHNDHPDEAQQRRLDFDEEAQMVLERAIENAAIWTQVTHPRATDVVLKIRRQQP